MRGPSGRSPHQGGARVIGYLFVWGVVTVLVKVGTALADHPIGWIGSAIIAAALTFAGVVIFFGDVNIGGSD